MPAESSHHHNMGVQIVATLSRPVIWPVKVNTDVKGTWLLHTLSDYLNSHMV